MSKTLCFNIINGVAQLPELHQLSDAGAGADLMHLTPTLDSEIIAYGHNVTQLPGQLLAKRKLSAEALALQAKGLLANGGVSPAVLAHGLLQLFSQSGYQIEFRSFNFSNPLPKPAAHDDWLVEHFDSQPEGKSGLLQQLCDALIEQAECGVISLLAECGVGGTTFSTLWLRGLTGLPLSPAGSTAEPEKLAVKARLLEQLEAQHLSSGFNLDYMLGSSQTHDDIQRALCALVTHWPAGRKMPLMAGGMMMLAPLLASYQRGDQMEACQFATTRWLMQGDSQTIASFLPAHWPLQLHRSDFNLSQHACLHRYEQGYVVEGCGLGGMLVLAEQQGFTESQIIAALDCAVSRHMARFEERSEACKVEI